jgi:hypothetical protein
MPVNEIEELKNQFVTSKKTQLQGMNGVESFCFG